MGYVLSYKKLGERLFKEVLGMKKAERQDARIYAWFVDIKW